MYYGYGIDIWYLVLVLPAFLISLFCQIRVKSTFNKYNKVGTSSGMSGAQAARAILDANGLWHIGIEQVAGELTDHFDPKANVVRLSGSTFASASVAAIGVAAHEAGHAVQHAEEYGPIRLRTAIVPICNIGAKLAWPAILLGYFLGLGGLVIIGIALFSLAVFFQLVTLPVEYNASRRAKNILQNYISPEELTGVNKVLNAAAMTYVAALAVSIASLLRLLMIFGRRNNRN